MINEIMSAELSLELISTQRPAPTSYIFPGVLCMFQVTHKVKQSDNSAETMDGFCHVFKNSVSCKCICCFVSWHIKLLRVTECPMRTYFRFSDNDEDSNGCL